MTFKKNSELDNTTKQDNKTSGVENKKHINSTYLFVAFLAFLAFIAFWAITTIVIPLTQSSGAEKYSGEFRALAEGIYDFESTNNKADPHVSSFYKIRIEDIYLTTNEERSKYCTDPERMTIDPNRTMAYTIVLSEQFIGWWGKDEYTIVGCQTSILSRAFK